jgi:hypothetical protein
MAVMMNAMLRGSGLTECALDIDETRIEKRECRLGAR